MTYALEITTRGKTARFDGVTFETFGVIHDNGAEELRFGAKVGDMLLDYFTIIHESGKNNDYERILSHLAGAGEVAFGLPGDIQWRISIGGAA